LFAGRLERGCLVVVRESAAELEELQSLLDRSYANAGRHLLNIHTPDRRPQAAEIAERLTGMCLLALATVTDDGKPVVGAVDGIFLHGEFHFGSSPDSIRMRHIARRPQVSAIYLPSEDLAITVHGRAVPAPTDPGSELREVLLQLYEPRYGSDWAQFLDSGPVYARIVADRMFAFRAIN
jgi:pyridoxamine 5'-phosphate oxidase-like protein